MGKKTKKTNASMGAFVNMVLLPIMAASVIAAYAVIRTAGSATAVAVKTFKNASLRFGGISQEEFVAPRD